MSKYRYIKKEEFEMRAYGFGELAQMYLPNIQPKSATNQLTRWIAQNKTLSSVLEDIGFEKGAKVLTPKQVDAILEHIGFP